MPGELIMELTGESRDTQVQPPVGAWVSYFRIDLEDPPSLRLGNVNGGPEEERPVVRHDHTWTIEIPDAACDRPALIKFTRVSKDHYTYEIIKWDHDEFDHYTWLIQKYPDIERTRGRYWRRM